MGFIGKAWRGEERLWRVFWLYGVLLGFAIGIVIGILQMILGDAMNIPAMVFQLIFSVWITVAEWRCAFNVNWRGWGYIVRGLIVLTILLLALGLVVGFGTGFSEQLDAAECRRELKLMSAGTVADPERFLAECRARRADQ